jgi:NADH dehydrogenase FAD-containing subunit
MLNKGDNEMMAQPKHSVNVVVVGGGYAGVMAALRLAGKTRKADVQLTLINGSSAFVERIRLHQRATGKPPRRYDLRALLQGSDVDFYQGWVTMLQPDQHTLQVETESGLKTLHYDFLIYAVGSTSDRTTIPGGAEHALALADEASADEVAARLGKVAGGGRLLVIGGGLTGIEMATEAAEAYPHLRVTMATRGALGESLSRQGADYVRRVFTEMGITLLETTGIVGIEATHACTEGGQTIPFDACLWAGSFRVPPLARRSGLPTDSAGRVLVDGYLRSPAYPNLYAVGDAASTSLRMACATALPMGAYAADHLAAHLTGQPSPNPFPFAYLLQCVSLGRRQGLVQFVHGDDRPREQVITGRLAAFVKEAICRYTVWSLQLEKRWPGTYRWPEATLHPTLPSVNRLPGMVKQHS